MPKQLRSYPIYLAPQIVGRIKSNGESEVFDEKTGEILDPTNIDEPSAKSRISSYLIKS